MTIASSKKLLVQFGAASSVVFSLSCASPGPSELQNTRTNHYIVTCQFPQQPTQIGALYQYPVGGSLSGNTATRRRATADVYECNNYPTYLFTSKVWSKRRRNATDYGFHVYIDTPMCGSVPTAYLLTNTNSAYDFLINRENMAQDSIDTLLYVLSKECVALPDKVAIKVVVRTAWEAVPPIDTKAVYYGELVIEGFEQPILFDSDSTIRNAAVDAEKERLQWEQTLRIADGARRRERNDKIAASVIGYIQGLTYEFSDEGTCALLTSINFKGNAAVSSERYDECKNFLDNYLGNLKLNHPGYYGISNLLGSMKTSLDLLLPEAKTREQEVARRAIAECAEGIMSEFGKADLGQTPDSDTLETACKFGAVLGGSLGAVAGPNRKKK